MHFYGKKWLLEKEQKKYLTYGSTKICVFQYLKCIKKYVTYSNCWALLTGSTNPGQIGSAI